MKVSSKDGLRCFCAMRCQRSAETVPKWYDLQYILIQTDKFRITKNKVEILQGLSRPKTLHAVDFYWIFDGDIVDSCVGNVRSGVFLNALKHLPGPVLQTCIPCDAVEDEDGLDGLRSDKPPMRWRLAKPP